VIDAEAADHVVDGQERSGPIGLQTGRIMPIGQDGVDAAAGQLLVEQRRGSEDRLDGLRDIDTEFLLGKGPEEKPALVERSACNADALALEVTEAPDLGSGRKHERADGP